jgi:hypothetical protein
MVTLPTMIFMKMASTTKEPSDNSLQDNMESLMNVLIFDDDKPIGYCVTVKEADALCDKHPSYQWDFYTKKYQQKYKNMNLGMMTIHD